jgi:hypothetical protein
MAALLIMPLSANDGHIEKSGRVTKDAKADRADSSISKRSQF